MGRIAVMGDFDSICMYSALGMEIFPITDEKEASKTLRSLSESGYAVIYIVEQLYFKIKSEIDKFSKDMLPAIIPIPGLGESLGIGMSAIDMAVKKAVGSDLAN